MKSSKLTAGLLLILSSLLFTNCTKDQNENYQSNTREIISQGKWSVDYFFAGQNLTSQYSSYKFSFTGNGTLKAFNGMNDLVGTWSMIRDVNGNDVIRILIDTQDPHLAELNAQWNVTNKTSNAVNMMATGSELRFKKQ